MSDIVEFLRARYGEDERAAQSLDAGVKPEWFHDPHTSADDQIAWYKAYLSHGPRAMRDVEAKRRVVDLYHLGFNDEGEPICLGGYGEAYWDVLRLLAFPYVDHPDYREEWRP